MELSESRDLQAGSHFFLLILFAPLTRSSVTMRVRPHKQLGAGLGPYTFCIGLASPLKYLVQWAGRLA